MVSGNRVVIRDDAYLSILTETSGRMPTELIRTRIAGEGNRVGVVAKEILT